jgi:hypothetical protein
MTQPIRRTIQGLLPARLSTPDWLGAQRKSNSTATRTRAAQNVHQRFAQREEKIQSAGAAAKAWPSLNKSQVRDTRIADSRGEVEAESTRSLINEQDWSTAQHVVASGRRDIRQAIQSAMQRSDILTVGETHEDSNPVRKNAIDLLNGAYAGGARTLYVELPNQAQLDRFVATGDKFALPHPVPHYPGYVAMLAEARRLGMKIIAVDTGVETAGTAKDVRDATMARIIRTTLPPNGKAVLWVGSLHAVPVSVVGSAVPSSFQNATALLERSGLKITTVIGIGKSNAIAGSPEAKLRSATPVLVDTRNFPESIRLLDPRLRPGDTDSSQLNTPLGNTPFTVPFGGADYTLHN